MVGQQFRPPGVTFAPGPCVIYEVLHGWLALPRVLLIGSVAYAAALIRPLPLTTLANVAVALALAALVLLLGAGLAIPIARVLGSLVCGWRGNGRAFYWRPFSPASAIVSSRSSRASS
jgi:hypothetical protein